MRNLFSRILTPTLFIVYTRITMGAVETALLERFGRGSELDTIWMLAALVILPLCGVLAGKTANIIRKFL